jgi:flagellar protein FliL
MEKDEEDIEETPQPKKKSPLKLIIIILIALIFIGAGAGAGIYYFGREKDTTKKEEKTAAPVVGTLWSQEPFIVNLADNQGERYLKVAMQFELSEPAVAAELDILKPRIRDNILDLLTVKTYAELMEPNGKQQLRDEIVLRMNSFLTKGKLTRVYFTDFVIQ